MLLHRLGRDTLKMVFLMDKGSKYGQFEINNTMKLKLLLTLIKLIKVKFCKVRTPK